MDGGDAGEPNRDVALGPGSTRRNRSSSRGFSCGAEGLGQFLAGVDGSPEYDQWRSQAHDLARALPGVELGGLVGADEQAKTHGSRQDSAEAAERVDGVTGLAVPAGPGLFASVDLVAPDQGVFAAPECEFEHSHSIGGAGDGASGFVRALGGGDVEDEGAGAGERGASGAARAVDVKAVGGVEGAAEDNDGLGSLWELEWCDRGAPRRRGFSRRGARGWSAARTHAGIVRAPMA